MPARAKKAATEYPPSAAALARARPVSALARTVITLGLLLAGTAQAADVPTFSVELRDGVISTRRIEVPAGQRFRIEVINKGQTPAEFESLPLGLELVVAPGGTRTRVLPGKSPGTYPFYDDFHQQTTQGVFVIK